MLRVGLTGGIGSGKSSVSTRLAALGAVVIDADTIAREVVESGTPGLAQIAEAFGPGVLREDGSLDRPKLAAIVFADEKALAQLNAITHPLIRLGVKAAEDAAVAAVAAGRGAGSSGGEAGNEVRGDDRDDLIVVHDVPLLAEGLRTAADFGVVIVVDVPVETQVARLTGPRGMPEDQARARIAAQASREQRLAVADIVIDNSGTLADLDRRVAEVWADLQARARV
jgi:dephospho-CoA kinase